MMQAIARPHIVLLGAGHAHVEVLGRAAMLPGVRLTLVARERFTPYSGMLPGLIRGDWKFSDAHVDCAALADAAGASLVVAEATGIDLAAKHVLFAEVAPVGFDLLSIDVGGLPAMPAGAGVGVKPVGRFLAHLEALERDLPPGARVAVVGAGASGVELALALNLRLKGRARIALIGADAEPLAHAPTGARRTARAALADAGVELLSGVGVARSDGTALSLSDGSVLDVAAAIWATGVAGPPFLAASGLDCDGQGCVRVDRCLRSLSHDFVFAAGDCAAMAGAALPKAGVWAVRAGPVLAGNLARAAATRPLRPWRPQLAALAILGLGDGRAVAWRGRLSVSGRWVARWKSYLDLRWITRFPRPQ